MAFIKYEQFKELLSKYDDFNEKVLNSIYSEFGEIIINNYFDKYFCSLKDDEEVTDFMNKYSVYFKQISVEQGFVEDNINSDFLKTEEILETFNEEEKDFSLSHDGDDVSDDDYLDDDNNGINKEEKRILYAPMNDMVKTIIDASARLPIMSVEMANEQGENLKNGRDNLIIIEKEASSEAYPKLKLEEIFLSIKNEEHIQLLKLVKSLPFKLEDEMILKKDIPYISKYLKLCKNGIPSKGLLIKNFPNLSFDNVNIVSSEDLSIQLKMLREYVTAKYNFINRNMRLVMSIAKKKCVRLVSLEDAVQYGNIGLIKAVNKFEPNKGCKFSTYATCWIRQNISREIANTADIIRKPVHMIDKIKKYETFINDYYSVNMCMPTDEECMIALNLTYADIREIKLASFNVVSLEAPVNSDSSEDTILMFIPSSEQLTEESVINAELFKQVLSIMNEKLKEKEVKVLLDRFGINDEHRGMTLEEIGAKFHVTRERIRQIESNALRKIRNKTRNIDIRD